MNSILSSIYFLDIFLLALYGFFALFQTIFYARHRPKESSDAIAPPQPDNTLPAVTVQLPIYNEQHVVQSLIETVTQLDWPDDKLQIQILDDSTDETTKTIRQVITQIQQTSDRPNLVIEHCHRSDRTGFKAGALQKGLDTATGEFIAIFDADFTPPANFLKRTIPAFDQDDIACVQSRWGHLNANSSLLTCAQSVGIDGHFVIEQQARHGMGALLNFNGTAGILRKASLEAVGGWQGDTLTEDLDLSYRLQLQGWRIVYWPQVNVPAELPVQLYALQRQQFRWAKGSLQTALKLGPELWLSSQTLWRKLLGTLHLTQYAVHPLMVINLLLILPVGLGNPLLFAAAPLVTLSSLGPPLMYWVAMGAEGLPWSLRLRQLGLLMVLGMGLSVNNSRAVLEALLGVQSEFQRTPKFAVAQRLTPWQTSHYALSGGWQVWVELALCLYALGLGSYSLSLGAWWVLPWLLLYTCGYATMVGLTWLQSWQRQKLMAAQATTMPKTPTTPTTPTTPLSPTPSTSTSRSREAMTVK